MTDYTVGDTFHIAFTTRQFSTGAPFTLAGTPAVSAYEDAGLTQITAGITLGVDHDSVTGLNMLTIVATSGNGYESGKDYHLVITTGTVDSVSVVGEVVGRFTLGRSAAAVDLANGTDGLGAIKAETAAILDDTDLIDDGTSGLAKIATDVAAVLVDTGTTLDGKLNTIDTNVDSILVDTGTTLQAELDAIQAAVITNAAGVDIAADIIAIKAETASILTDTAEIGAAGAGLTDLGGMSTGMKAEVNAEVDTALATTTYAEPAQGAPGATVSLKDKIGFLYKAWRNKSDQDATTYQLYNDDASTVDHKATVSDDGTTATKGEVATGP